MNEPTRDLMSTCGVCEYCKFLKPQDDWSFHGCFHEPYKGKWIVDITTCPKEREVEQKMPDKKPTDITVVYC